MSVPLMSDQRIAEIRQAAHVARQSARQALPVEVVEELLREVVRAHGFLDSALDEIEAGLQREAALAAEIAGLRAEAARPTGPTS